MVEFFGLLAVLSSSYAISTVSLEGAQLSLDLVIPLLSATAFPVLYRKHLASFSGSQQLFAAFMDQLPAYAWIKSTDGSYVYVNDRVKALPPFQQDYLGKTDADLWPAELADLYRANDLKVITSGDKVETSESFVLNGEQRNVLVSRFPIFDELGTVIMVGGTSVDITEQKRVEKALRESESLRRMIIEAEPECVKLVAPDYTLLEMNPAGLKMIEASSREQVVGQSVLNLIAPECHDTYLGMHQRVCQGQSAVTEFDVIGLKGSRRRLESHAAPLLDKESRVIAQLAITRDVTERKRAEKAQRETEQKYRSIFENAVEGIFQTTPGGRFIAANPALARMLGFDSPEDLMNTRTDIAREHYVDRQSRAEFVRLMEESGFVRDFEFQAFRKDGSKIWFSENVRAVRDETGTVVYYEGTTQDITGRKQAEEALRESEERYRDLVENSLDLICTHDLDGTILSANRAAMQVMGYGSESYAGGTNLRDILSPEVRDQVNEYLKEIRSAGVASGVMMVRTRTGEKRIWEYHNTLRTQGVAAPIVRGMARDITERRRANHSLRLFRTLIDRSSDAIEVIDPETLRFLDCNKNAHEHLGYSREELLSLTVYDIDPQLEERMAARLLAKLKRSGFAMFESIHRRKDGSTFPVEVSLTAVHLEREYRLAVVRDITERKAADKALRDAEQKYRRIFENASEGIFQLTPERKFTAANPALALMYGFDSPEEMIRSCNELSQQIFVDASRREDFRKLIERDGVVRDFEYQSLLKDGRKIWISLNARTVRDDKGAIRYYEGTTQDITDRKHAEGELLRQKEILQNIVDHIPVMISFTESHGRFRLVNREWQQTLGWSLEEVQNQDLDIFSECYPDPQYRQRAANFISAAPGDWGDFKTRKRDGTVIDTSWFRVRLSEGTTIGIGQDVTARKRAEHALRQAEQKYRELFENAKDAIYVHDLKGRYTSINRAAERLTGYSREEILGKDFHGFVGPEYEANMRDNLCRKLRQDGETTYEVEVITKDGRRVPVEVSSRLIYEEGVPVGVQGIARNIAERKRAEEALRGYSRQLIRVQEAERESIARELHDQIGQVLTAVRINLETVRSAVDPLEANILIDEGVTIVDEAIQQVRDLSFELRPSLLDDLGLSAALRWYADRWGQRTGIKIETSICPRSRTRLPGELETACFRIIQEALTNVARHAQAKSVSVNVETTRGALSLSIKDDGIGFDFHSAANGELLNRLGLRGMEERARGLGGTFEINSAPREGTEIRVLFPKGAKRPIE